MYYIDIHLHINTHEKTRPAVIWSVRLRGGGGLGKLLVKIGEVFIHLSQVDFLVYFPFLLKVGNVELKVQQLLLRKEDSVII